MALALTKSGPQALRRDDDGSADKCVLRAVPFERYYEVIRSIFGCFLEAGRDVSKMHSPSVLTVSRKTLLQMFGEAMCFPHVFGAPNDLTKEEVAALLRLIESLPEAEVLDGDDCIEVDPNEPVRAFVDLGGDLSRDVVVRIGDILSHTVKAGE